MAPTFQIPPPDLPSSIALISFPAPHVLLVTFNRPSGLNSLPTTAHWPLHTLFQWYDNEPALRCCIVTGSGRAFCAGADLKEWDRRNHGEKGEARGMPTSGFGALSRRIGKKPVIGAVNGIAFGGGMEIVVNLDLVVASEGAKFSLPEVKRGVVALAGALPRLVKTVGKQKAMEIALTGRVVGAKEACELGFVNCVVENGEGEDVLNRPVVKKALEFAGMIANNSPDSVIISKAGIVAGWEDGSAEHGTQSVVDVWEKRLNDGENIKEGVRAFVEKREPRWRDSKL